jgi:hypothetical protein
MTWGYGSGGKAPVWQAHKSLSSNPSTTTKKKKERAKVGYTCDPSTQRLRQEDHEFKTILGYLASFSLPGLRSETQFQTHTHKWKC